MLVALGEVAALEMILLVGEEGKSRRVDGGEGIVGLRGRVGRLAKEGEGWSWPWGGVDVTASTKDGEESCCGEM